ncbi:MAG: hypothetical protein ACOX79_08290 [Methanosarcina sp.]
MNRESHHPSPVSGGRVPFRRPSSTSRVPLPEFRFGSTVPFSLRSRGLIYPNFFLDREAGVITNFFKKSLIKNANLFRKGLIENSVTFGFECLIPKPYPA